MRLFALGWTLLSLLGLVLGGMFFAYAATWGCVGAPQGWLACSAPTLLIVLAAAGSLFSAVVLLFFSQLFYLAGADAKTDGPRRRPRLRGLLLEVIADILD
ncbi:MAG: hypothetical protein ACREO3_05610 [Arenimonas sp.]